MRLIQSIIAGFLFAAVALVSPAKAIDWTGWYVGLNGGYGWSTTTPEFGVVGPPGNYYTFGAGQVANVANVTLIGNVDLGASGFTGGAHVGYLKQIGTMVFGLEADFAYYNPDAAVAVGGVLTAGGPGNGPAPFFITHTVDADWFASLRARFGFTAQENLLLYGTVGAAITNLSFTTTYADATVSPVLTSAALRANFTTSRTVLGMVLGLGAEYAFTANWLLRLEYLYLQFLDVGGSTIALPTAGVTTGTCPPGGSGNQFCSSFSHSPTLATQILRAAISYKLP